MLNTDSVQYAIENTQVILSPQNRIETFGTTVFRFYLVTELMDTANHVRVRDGRLHAERPSIITPSHLHQILGEDFGENVLIVNEDIVDAQPVTQDGQEN